MRCKPSAAVRDAEIGTLINHGMVIAGLKAAIVGRAVRIFLRWERARGIKETGHRESARVVMDSKAIGHILTIPKVIAPMGTGRRVINLKTTSRRVTGHKETGPQEMESVDVRKVIVRLVTGHRAISRKVIGLRETGLLATESGGGLGRKEQEKEIVPKEKPSKENIRSQAPRGRAPATVRVRPRKIVRGTWSFQTTRRRSCARR
jgi:hypothetical protein